ELQGSMGVIRKTCNIDEKEIVGKRFFVKDGELLCSSDGITFAVSSQWGIGNIANVVNLARRLGYDVSASE
ncbi:MAG: hypothetical protein IKX93_03030, partial [Bacteroidaceae bacterium]|nr:hypothetical protein [Bacteroidaceae bacterium]